MAKRSKLAAVLDETADQPAVRALMASVAAGGAIAAGKVVSNRVAKRGQRKRRRYRLEPGEAPIEGVGQIARGQLDLTVKAGVSLVALDQAVADQRCPA